MLNRNHKRTHTHTHTYPQTHPYMHTQTNIYIHTQQQSTRLQPRMSVLQSTPTKPSANMNHIPLLSAVQSLSLSLSPRRAVSTQTVIVCAVEGAWLLGDGRTKKWKGTASSVSEFAGKVALDMGAPGAGGVAVEYRECCIHTCIHTRIFVAYICIYVMLHTCMHACIQHIERIEYVHVSVCVCIYVRAHVCVCVCVYVYIYICIYIYIYIYILHYVYTHTSSSSSKIIHLIHACISYYSTCLHTCNHTHNFACVHAHCI